MFEYKSRNFFGEIEKIYKTSFILTKFVALLNIVSPKRITILKNKITSFILLLLCLALNVSDAIAQKKHKYVDLGLPSGTLWATTNVGAENPWDYGDYFAWGETTTKSKYDWSTYKYANGADDKLTKYCYNSEFGNNGFTDDKTELERSDDAASFNWGSDWCIPTQDQLQELDDECTWTWTTDHGIDGYKVIGANGKSIFLPAAGCRYGTDLFGVGSYGHYWSSSLNTDDQYNGRYLDFDSGGVFPDYRINRRYGQTVRAVRCRN